MFRKAFGVPEAERIQLGKEIWKIAADEVWHIGDSWPVGRGRRCPRRQDEHGQRTRAPVNSPDGKTPGHLAARDVLLEDVAAPAARAHPGDLFGKSPSCAGHPQSSPRA